MKPEENQEQEEQKGQDQNQNQQNNPSIRDSIDSLKKLKSLTGNEGRAGEEQKGNKLVNQAKGKVEQAGKKVVSNVGKRVGKQALKKVAVAAGQALVETAPVWGIPALILFIIIVVFVIIFGGTSSVNGGTLTCGNIGGTCARSCLSPSVPDTTGATCSSSALPTCCVPQYTGGGDLPPGIFKPPFKCGLSYFGTTYPTHNPYAVDFSHSPQYHDPVLASANGKVVEVIPSNGQVRINHAGGYQTAYAHMINILIRLGDTVKAGQQIGQIDNTGLSSGAHLHFAQLLNGVGIKMSFNGIPYPNSLNPAYWTPPGPRITGECP